MKDYLQGSCGWRHPINLSLQTSCLLDLILFGSALKAQGSRLVFSLFVVSRPLKPTFLSLYLLAVYLTMSKISTYTSSSVCRHYISSLVNLYPPPPPQWILCTIYEAVRILHCSIFGRINLAVKGSLGWMDA